MYSSELVQNIVKRDISYMSAGIHENVKFVGIRFDQSPTGNKFIEMKFQQGNKILNHTEWEPTRRPDEDDASFQSKCTNQMSRLKQIFLCFFSDSEFSFNCSTFSQFALWFVTKMESADKEKLVRLKIVYSDNGYLVLPRYCVYTFIEPMTIEKEKSAITRLSIDRFERPVVADKENSNPNPLITADTLGNSSMNDELPF